MSYHLSGRTLSSLTVQRKPGVSATEFRPGKDLLPFHIHMLLPLINLELALSGKLRHCITTLPMAQTPLTLLQQQYRPKHPCTSPLTYYLKFDGKRSSSAYQLRFYMSFQLAMLSKAIQNPRAYGHK